MAKTKKPRYNNFVELFLVKAVMEYAEKQEQDIDRLDREGKIPIFAKGYPTFLAKGILEDLGVDLKSWNIE